MERLYHLSSLFVEDSIPRDLEHGTLYISEKYGTAVHLCACGCGIKSVMPFKPKWSDGWDMVKGPNGVTFSPSVGNFGMPCRSHYFIRENRVEWVEEPLKTAAPSSEEGQE